MRQQGYNEDEAKEGDQCYDQDRKTRCHDSATACRALIVLTTFGGKAALLDVLAMCMRIGIRWDHT